MGITKVLKDAVSHGYIFITVAVICLICVFTMYLVWGDLKNITTDPDDPGVAKGILRYMEETAYDRYRGIHGAFLGTGFITGILGIILYLLWKYRQPTI